MLKAYFAAYLFIHAHAPHRHFYQPFFIALFCALRNTRNVGSFAWPRWRGLASFTRLVVVEVFVDPVFGGKGHYMLGKHGQRALRCRCCTSWRAVRLVGRLCSKHHLCVIDLSLFLSLSLSFCLSFHFVSCFVLSSLPIMYLGFFFLSFTNCLERCVYVFSRELSP